jgi:hypothetical protein
MSAIQHSLYGRSLGLDASGYVTSPKGAALSELKAGVSGSEVSVIGANSVTSPTTAQTVSAGGTSIFNATAAKSYSLAAPIAGVEKVLTNTTTSTAARTITLASGNIVSTSLSTGTILTMTGLGQTARLIGLSTAQYAVISNTAALT